MTAVQGTGQVSGQVRRTQQERRERTIGLVVDAAIASLCEHGYTGTTVTTIGVRAGVSQGGMFRHFGTRLDIVVAAAEAVCERQLALFVAQAAVTDGSVRALLELTRAACREPMNAAWQELLSAARTDVELRVRLAPTVARYYDHIVELAGTQQALRAIPRGQLAAVVMTVIHAFDGEALARAVHPQPELDETRLQLLEAGLVVLLRGADGP